MLTNRAIKLLNLLNPNEQEELLSYFKKTQKKKCYLTAKSIIKHQKKKGHYLDKEAIFLDVYNIEYTAENDYLLRNDFRLLSKYIEEFCGSSDVFPVIGETKILNFLVFLLRSNDYDFLEKEFSSKKEYFDNPTLIEWFNKVQQDYQFKHLNFTEEALEVFEKHLDAQYKLILDNTAVKLAELNTRKSFINRQRQLMGLGERMPIQDEYTINLLSKNQNNSVHYLGLKSASYAKNGHEAIAMLKECETILQSAQIQYFNLEEEQIWLQSNLGFHYFLISNFENSAHHFFQALNHPYINNYQLKDNIVYNYVSTCFKMKDYETAKELIETYGEELSLNNRLKYKFKFHEIILYLCTRDFDSAKKTVGAMQAPKLTYEFYYFKTLLMLIYILNNEHSRAVMELNIYKTLNFPEGQMENLHKKMALFFKHFIRLQDRLETLEVWESASAKIVEDTFKLQSSDGSKINFYDSILIDLLKEKMGEMEQKRNEI